MTPPTAGSTNRPSSQDYTSSKQEAAQDRKEAAKQIAAQKREAREQQLASEAAAKEDAHKIHGEPDCLTVDDRTLSAKTGEYNVQSLKLKSGEF